MQEKQDLFYVDKFSSFEANSQSKDQQTKVQHLLSKLKSNKSQFIVQILKRIKLIQSLLQTQRNSLEESIFNSISKALEPQINYLKFEKGFNANLYPVFGMIAWYNEKLGYHMIDHRLCSYVEGGGVRCIPVVLNDLDDEKNLIHLKNMLNNIHGLIIPQFFNPSSSIILSQLLRVLKSHNKQLIVMSFGNSSNRLFVNNTNKSQTNLKVKQLSGLVQGSIVCLSSSIILSDINPALKFNILTENLSYRCSNLRIESIQPSQNLVPEAYLVLNQRQSTQILPFLWRQTISSNVSIYHSFLQLFDQSNNLVCCFFNKIMVNFVNLAKKAQQIVMNPTKFVAYYPLEMKQTIQKTHYKIITSK